MAGSGVYMANTILVVLLLLVVHVSVVAMAVTPALGVRRFSRDGTSLSSPRQSQGHCQQSGCSEHHISSSCCNGICVDVSQSVKNCGACNNSCAYDRECCSGVCVDIHTSDSQNCGACGRVCSEGVLCLFGMCGYGSGRIIIP